MVIHIFLKLFMEQKKGITLPLVEDSFYFVNFAQRWKKRIVAALNGKKKGWKKNVKTTMLTMFYPHKIQIVLTLAQPSVYKKSRRDKTVQEFPSALKKGT